MNGQDFEIYTDDIALATGPGPTPELLYSVYLQLVSASGTVLSQSDYPVEVTLMDPCASATISLLPGKSIISADSGNRIRYTDENEGQS